MILFKKFLVAQIQAGRKTETRRLGKKRWNVGTIHQVRQQYYQKVPDCHVRIINVYQERLSAITDEAVKREGLDMTPDEFIAKFREINAGKAMENDPLVWVVQFEKVEQQAWKECSFLEHDGPAGDFCWHPNRVDACLHEKCPMPPVQVNLGITPGSVQRIARDESERPFAGFNTDDEYEPDGE